ncbi:MAG: toll/interleukin-1 receptor domain-containing protein [Rhizobiaceae bacterium]|nr:toll/interleukin-1 receptor domain-containing protein [Rhizobiaceae bacterium]
MVEISNGLEFRAWLENKPLVWAQVLAARIALRVFPAINEIFNQGNLPQDATDNLVYSTYRALSISWVACRFPTHNITASVAANAATDAKAAAANAAFNNIANYTTAAAHANAATFAAAHTTATNADLYAANAATNAATDAAGTVAETWTEINVDIDFLQNSIDDLQTTARNLAGKKLWLNSQNGNSAPNWALDSLRDLEKNLIKLDENWHIWIDWYRQILQGKPSWGLSPKNAEQLIDRIATQEDEFWDQGATVVNAMIAKWLAEFRAEEKPQNREKDVLFVSYANENEQFAKWVVEVLEAAGKSTVVQYRDFETGSNFVREMQKGLDKPNRMIALLSPGYEKSDHCQAEWAAFYNEDPSGEKRKLVPLMVGKTSLNGLAKQVVYSRIYDLSPEQAKQKILTAIGYDGDVKTPDEWPGGDVLETLRGVGASVYDVQPDKHDRLQETPVLIRSEDISGFPPEQIYDEMRDQAKDLCKQLENGSHNHFYSSALQERAKDWAETMAQPMEGCNPLVLNKKIVWLLRTFAFDIAQGNLSKADQVQIYVGDLQVYYKRLAVVFPNLKQYRETNARERFELPTDAEDEAIRAVLDFFGDPKSSGDIFGDLLIKSLREVGDDREAASNIPESDDSEEARKVKVEAEFDAGNRTLAIWRWIANSKTLLGRGGKSADELAKSIGKYDKAYKALEPHMEKVIDYLSRWML